MIAFGRRPRRCRISGSFARSLLWFALVAVASGDETQWDETQWIVSLEGRPVAARLIRVEGPKAKFLDERNRERTLTISKMVRWGSLSSPRLGHQVVLRDGSLLLGHVTQFSAGKLRLETDTFGELSIPRDSVACVVWKPPAIPLDQWKLRDTLVRVQGDEDQLILVGGDRLTGELTAVSSHRVQFSTVSGEVQLRHERIVAWRPVGSRVEPTQAHETNLLGLKGGEQLVADEFELSDTLLAATLRCGVWLASLPEVRPAVEGLVCYYRPKNPKVVYLSDIQPLGYKHIPFLGVPWEWAADRSVVDGPISTLRQVQAKGIGMHSTGRLAFDLPGEFREFQAEIGIDQSAGQQGSVTFRLFVSPDGRSWKSAFQSEVIRGGDPPAAMRVDIQDARRIALVVDFADRGDVLDRANWMDARLVR